MIYIISSGHHCEAAHQSETDLQPPGSAGHVRGGGSGS